MLVEKTISIDKNWMRRKQWQSVSIPTRYYYSGTGIAQTFVHEIVVAFLRGVPASFWRGYGWLSSGKRHLEARKGKNGAREGPKIQTFALIARAIRPNLVNRLRKF